MDYIYLTLYWTAYYALHSYLASDRVKQYAFSRLGNENSWRIIYTVISTVGILFLFFKMATIIEDPLWPENTLIKFVSFVCITYGLIIIKLSFKNQSVRVFLTKEDRFTKSTLKTSGIYAKVRHPLYSGTILIFLGLFLFIPKISTAIALAITLLYLAVGIRLEEKKLILKFGDKYVSYKKEVPALIPGLF